MESCTGLLGSTGLSVLTNDIPATWINIPKCMRCGNGFGKTKGAKQRDPCLLPCGHTLCSCCLYTLKDHKKDVKCAECSAKIQGKNSSHHYRNEYDYYLMGFLNFQKYYLPNMVRSGSFDMKPVPKTKSSDSQCIECSMCRKYICVQCSSKPYCNPCFVKVHSVGVVIRTHKLEHMDRVTIGEVLGLCKNHHKKPLDHYCQTCSQPICTVCSNTTHNQHDTTSLIKNNRKVQLNESLNVLKSVQKMVEESLKSFKFSSPQTVTTTFQYPADDFTPTA